MKTYNLLCVILGISTFPTSQSGKELPNARVISSFLFPEKKLVDPVWNLNAQQWGQIITHDMSLTAGVAQSRKYNVVLFWFFFSFYFK